MKFVEFLYQIEIDSFDETRNKRAGISKINDKWLDIEDIKDFMEMYSFKNESLKGLKIMFEKNKSICVSYEKNEGCFDEILEIIEILSYSKERFDFIEWFDNILLSQSKETHQLFIDDVSNNPELLIKQLNEKEKQKFIEKYNIKYENNSNPTTTNIGSINIGNMSFTGTFDPELGRLISSKTIGVTNFGNKYVSKFESKYYNEEYDFLKNSGNVIINNKVDTRIIRPLSVRDYPSITGTKEINSISFHKEDDQNIYIIKYMDGTIYKIVIKPLNM